MIKVASYCRVSTDQADHLAEKFRAEPEKLYHGILQVLLEEQSKDKE